MAGYIGNVPVPQATQTRDSFTATAGQTTFSTSGYTPGYLDVYLNGSHLDPSDYVATNGTDVVLNDAAAVDDVMTVVAYSTFELANQDFSGDFTVDTDSFHVDSTNNHVGIGTTSPNYPLHIIGTDANHQLRVEKTGTGNINVGVDSTGGFVETQTNIPLRFYEYGSETMRLDNGNVGINTTVSNSAVNIYNDTNTQIQFYTSGTGTSSTGGARVGYNGSGAQIWNFEDTYLRFATNNAERGRFSNGGTFLVGTTSDSGSSAPDNSSSASDAGVRVDGNGYIGIGNNTNPSLYLNIIGNSNGDIARFNKDGSRVGSMGVEGGDSLYIQGGTTSGAGLLCHGGAGKVLPVRNGASIDNTIDLGQDSRRFKDLYLSGKAQADTYQFAQNSSAVGVTEAVYRPTTGQMAFKTNSAERMRIDNNGHFMVGKTSTAAGAGTILGSDGVCNFTADSDRPVIMNRQTDDGDILEFRKDNSKIGIIGVESNDNFKISASQGGGAGLLFWGAGGTNPTINPLKENASSDGEVSFGRSTERFKDIFITGTLDSEGNNAPAGMDAGGLIYSTPAYDEYHYSWSGLQDHTVTLTCGSYFMAEVWYTSHQTNGGSDIHQYIRGKWANNHTTHTWNVMDTNGNTSAINLSITVGQNTVTNSGKLTITEDYTSGSYAGSRLVVRAYYGTFGITHT